MIENEIEKKALITEEQYSTLSENIAGGSVKITQINYYFDTEDRALSNKKETLRIRQIENRLEVQFKYGRTMDQGNLISKEFCEEISFLPESILVNGFRTCNIGFLITERTKVEFDAYTVFLDKNYYFGKVDYEIEVEAADVRNMPDELFGIKFNDKCRGKYTRFINELLNQKGSYEISK